MASASETGTTPYFNNSLSNTVIAVKTTGGRLYGYHIENLNTVPVYVQFFNKTVANVTLGATVPSNSLEVPAGGVLDAAAFAPPWAYSIAISLAATTTSTGSTAPSTAVMVNLWYL